jgi:hypothetical protein
MSVLPADTQLLFTRVVHTTALTSTALIKPTITSDLTAPVIHTSGSQAVAMDQMTIGASKLYLLPKDLNFFSYTKEIFFNFAQDFDLFLGSEGLKSFNMYKVNVDGCLKILGARKFLLSRMRKSVTNKFGLCRCDDQRPNP